ncbi:MAG: hypothetical protein V4760_17975 [Bdellovibrionota bacterium]
METLKAITRIFLIAGLAFSMSTTAFAQGTAPEQRAKPSGGPRRQLATILFAGLGGAVLGLSTLSFYGRPQEKLVNIAYGFALGVIGGTAYVTAKAATGPSEFYGQTSAETDADWTHTNKMAMAPSQAPPMLGLNFEF